VLRRVFSFPLDALRGHEMLTIKIQHQLPSLGFTIRDEDAVAQVRFDEGNGGWFYATEFDGRDGFYGYGASTGWGFRSLKNLANETDEDDMPLVHRDVDFEPATVRECLDRSEDLSPEDRARADEVGETRVRKLGGLSVSRHPSGESNRFKLHLGQR